MAITVEKLENLRRDFIRYDENRDGLLTVKEYEKTMEPYTTPETLAYLVSSLDPDKDNAISWTEFLTIYVNDVIGRPVIRVELIEQFDKNFKSMDTDNDGKLTENELVEFMKDNNSIAIIENTLAFYRDSDLNKDGKYTWDEFFVCYVKLFE